MANSIEHGLNKYNRSLCLDSMVDLTTPLTVRQMEVIYAVARHGSVSEAARSLGVSQPAVSVMIKECSRVSGVQLFERRQGRLQPTPEAGALLSEIERVQNAVRRVQSLVSDFSRTPRGYLRVAAVPIMADHLVPSALTASQRELTGIDVSLICRDYEEIPDLLEEGRIDVGLSSSLLPSSSPDVIDLWVSQLAAVLNSEHPLAKRSIISAQEMAQHPFISFNHNIPIGLAADKVFEDAAEAPRIAVEVSQTSTAISCAREGLGIAIVHPLGLAMQQRDKIRAKPILPASPFWNQVLLPKSGHLNRPTQLFIAALRRVVPQMRQIEAAVLEDALE